MLQCWKRDVCKDTAVKKGVSDVDEKRRKRSRF